jgi:alkaline phosphatase
MALVATAGSDSIITDSANSASAYATGHKTASAAMGVYADRTINPFDDPKVETIASLAKRRLGLGIGIVTNTEVEDATPAAMIRPKINRRIRFPHPRNPPAPRGARRARVTVAAYLPPGGVQ